MDDRSLNEQADGQVEKQHVGGQLQLRTFVAAFAFYTCLPIPDAWALEFRGVARFAPVVGLAIGGLLGLLDLGLHSLGMPALTRSAVVIAAWVALTGGFHLDGAIDTADGLAIQDPERRLEAMADSRTGAFGAITAVIILLLKTAALSDLGADRWLGLMAVAGWGRWGQLVAIVRYPYLKPTGKGAFHKVTIRSAWEVVPSLVLLLALGGVQVALAPDRWLRAVATIVGGGTIAFLTGLWFNQKLGGHTGDTYGAIVEWTEALLLCLMTNF